MSKAKSAAVSKSNEDSISVIREATCPTSSGKSTLAYHVGKDDSGNIFIKVSGNDGGGFWSPEWVPYRSIEQALSEWPADQRITSMAFRKIFRGKSANTPGFLVAVLCAVGILEPMGDKKRVHQACDPAAFLASVQSSRKAAEKTQAKAKSAPRAKAKSPAKPRTKTTSTRGSKSPRKAAVKTPKRP